MFIYKRLLIVIVVTTMTIKRRDVVQKIIILQWIVIIGWWFLNVWLFLTTYAYSYRYSDVAHAQLTSRRIERFIFIITPLLEMSFPFRTSQCRPATVAYIWCVTADAKFLINVAYIQKSFKSARFRLICLSRNKWNVIIFETRWIWHFKVNVDLYSAEHHL